MNDIVLRLSGIEKAYNQGQSNEISVLRGVDLKLRAGEVVALVAPSGAGKSTLLQIAGLLDTADAGRVELAGQNLSTANDRVRTVARRRDMGFVYQFHHLLPEFSGIENVVLPQLADGVSPSAAQARAQELLAQVGLDARGHHRPAELSGGEQQRVAFCRAMANAPRVLLADEPTGNLDPSTSDALFETLLNMVARSGMAALIATHNMELAARMGRIVRLDNGVLTDGLA